MSWDLKIHKMIFVSDEQQLESNLEYEVLDKSYVHATRISYIYILKQLGDLLDSGVMTKGQFDEHLKRARKTYKQAKEQEEPWELPVVNKLFRVQRSSQ